MTSEHVMSSHACSAEGTQKTDSFMPAQAPCQNMLCDMRFYIGQLVEAYR